MSDLNDPNDPANRPKGRAGQFSDPAYRNQGMGTGAWIVGIVAAILVIGGIFWGMSGDGQQTATDTSPPAATTGSGTTTGAGGAGTPGSATGTGGKSAPSTPPANQAAPPANSNN